MLLDIWMFNSHYLWGGWPHVCCYSDASFLPVPLWLFPLSPRSWNQLWNWRMPSICWTARKQSNWWETAAQRSTGRTPENQRRQEAWCQPSLLLLTQLSTHSHFQQHVSSTSVFRHFKSCRCNGWQDPSSSGTYHPEKKVRHTERKIHVWENRLMS